MMKHKLVIAPWSLLAAVLVFSCGLASAQAQATAAQTPTAPQTQAPINTPGQAAEVQNLPTALNFTLEQQQQWRQINREFGGQQLAARTKLRDARLALNEAVESPTPNEDLIKQRAREVSDAQSAVTQLQALRQARVLQILTPEQRAMLKQIRERAEFRREQGAKGLNQPPLRKNPNATAVTPAQRKALRQQRKDLKAKP